MKELEGTKLLTNSYPPSDRLKTPTCTRTFSVCIETPQQQSNWCRRDSKTARVPQQILQTSRHVRIGLLHRERWITISSSLPLPPSIIRVNEVTQNSTVPRMGSGSSPQSQQILQQLAPVPLQQPTCTRRPRFELSPPRSSRTARRNQRSCESM